MYINSLLPVEFTCTVYTARDGPGLKNNANTSDKSLDKNREKIPNLGHFFKCDDEPR
jgi:hypothetical protein